MGKLPNTNHPFYYWKGGFSDGPGETKLAIGNHPRHNTSRLDKGPTNCISYWILNYICYGICSTEVLAQSVNVQTISRVLDGITVPMGNEIYIPKWKPSDVYVHIGEEDPFCFTEVRFETWWLTNNARTQHCNKEMEKTKCVLLKTIDVADDIGLATVKRIIRCIGLKQNTHEIKQQTGSWRRIWNGNYTKPGMIAGMPHVKATPVVMIKRNGRNVLMNAQILEYGLVYFDSYNMYIGVLSDRGDRKDIPSKYFEARPLNSIIYTTGNDTTKIKYGNNRCDEIIRIEICSGNGCPPWLNDAPQIVGHWGQGGQPCKRKPTPIVELYYHPEKMLIDDSIRSWWSALFGAITKEIGDVISQIFRYILGINWEGKVLQNTLIYYVTVTYTRNNWLATAATAAVVASGF